MKHRPAALSVSAVLGLAILMLVACSGSGTAPAAPQQIRYGDDPAQFGWLTVPSEQDPGEVSPVVVLLHGGFWKEPWDYTLMSPLAQSLADDGYATWNIEVRRVGGRGGWPTTFDDVAAAIDHLDTLAEDMPLDPDQVVLVGHSSGGHLAMWSLGRDDATVQPVGVIGLAPIVDLHLTDSAAELLGGSAEEVPDRFRLAAPTMDPERVVVLHGADDTTIGADHAVAAFEAGLRVEHLADVDHFEIIEPDSPARPLLAAELARLLDR